MNARCNVVLAFASYFCQLFAMETLRGAGSAGHVASRTTHPPVGACIDRLGAILFAIFAFAFVGSGCRTTPGEKVLPVWAERITGTYDGEVFNEGKMCPVATQFEVDTKSGIWGVSGQYAIVNGKHVIRGQFFRFEFTGDRQLRCKWLDSGTGYLVIAFDESFSSFSGYWYDDDDSTMHPWNGRTSRTGKQ